MTDITALVERLRDTSVRWVLHSLNRAVAERREAADALEACQARAEKAEAALHKLNIAAAKYRAATDHHLGWTLEHPHLKPLLAAMMDARNVLAGDKP